MVGQLSDNTTHFLKIVGSGWGRTLEETTVQFWMPRDTGVFKHCTVPIGTGKILCVAEEKCTVMKIWMRLGFSGNRAKCEINETHAKSDKILTMITHEHLAI